MLARVTWAVRLAACVLVAFLTLVPKPPTGAALVVEVVGYLLCVGAIGRWLHADLTGRTNSATMLIGIAVMAAAAGVCCLAPRGGAFIGFSIMAVLAGAAEKDGRTGWITAAIAVLGIEVGALLYGVDNKAWQYPLVLFIVFISGRNRRAHSIQAAQAAALVTQLEQLRAEQRQVAVLDERNRIAREVHDVLAHSLGALGIHLQATRALLGTGDVQRAVTLLEQAQRMATDGLVDTRRAVQALRGKVGRLEEQLAELAQTHRDRHATTVDYTVDGEPGPIPPEVTVALIRIAQEGLVNAAKHAPRQPVEVRLSFRDDDVQLRIDNALVAEPAHDFSTVDGGFGLVGMRERLLLINGTLTVGPADGRWTVVAQAPR